MSKPFTLTQQVVMKLAQADAPITFQELTGKLHGVRDESVRASLRSAETQGFVSRINGDTDTPSFAPTENGTKVVRLLYAMPIEYAGRSLKECLSAANGSQAPVVAQVEVSESFPKILVALVDKPGGATPSVIEAETRLAPHALFRALATMIENGLVNRPVMKPCEKSDEQSDTPGPTYVLTSSGYTAATDELAKRKRNSGIR
ncbi:MarR family transcriptional regulator [Kibdelosporangium persicum]|uniref:MarR family transcriptional regulator n=1 Tax=Kibdelosporangium persicum TaxID=2698649 RepID=UPI001567A049|nr:MarR family transcriptional regulator [Kibdelosporangium persicum]